ncbi:MAG: SCP2 sterol-binding domain-containing protein [Acidimicrobiales bacterium]
MFLSPAWFREADALLASNLHLSERSRGVQLVLEQRVVSRSDASESIWHMRFEDGTNSIGSGPAENADVVFVTDAVTAQGIHDGSISAQAAFIAGELRVEGSISALLKHAQLFADLQDVLGQIR